MTKRKEIVEIEAVDITNDREIMEHLINKGLATNNNGIVDVTEEGKKYIDIHFPGDILLKDGWDLRPIVERLDETIDIMYEHLVIYLGAGLDFKVMVERISNKLSDLVEIAQLIEKTTVNQRV